MGSFEYLTSLCTRVKCALEKAVICCTLIFGRRKSACEWRCLYYALRWVLESCTLYSIFVPSNFQLAFCFSHYSCCCVYKVDHSRMWLRWPWSRTHKHVVPLYAFFASVLLLMMIEKTAGLLVKITVAFLWQVIWYYKWRLWESSLLWFFSNPFCKETEAGWWCWW